MTTPWFISRDHKVSLNFILYNQIFFHIAQFSVKENLLVVAGTPETKELKDMMPDILKQVGPQQYQYLKTQIAPGDAAKEAEAKEDDDDVPELVGTFEDAAKKWEHQSNHWTMQVAETRSFQNFTQSIELSK